jgi:hypothetical protein
MNIITLKSCLKEIRIVGYEYVNVNTRKEWWNTYEDGDLLWNLDYWSELNIKKLRHRIYAITGRNI